MYSSWFERFNAACTLRKAQHGWRERHLCSMQFDNSLRINGKVYLNFSSNDYLGLSHSNALIKAWQEGAQLFGVGSGSSSHIIGYTSAHAEFERSLAQWLGYPRALIFNSGFAANQAVIHTLAQKKDAIIADKLCHASILDAAHHSEAILTRFHHNDPVSLQQRLEQSRSANKLVITEGVFSMDGDLAPLKEIATMAKGAQALLVVDDAHGIGAYGERGKGSCHLASVHPDILVVTFGKAFGLSGAAILCNEVIADYFVQFSRHLIYSTSMPPALAYTLLKSLSVIDDGNELRQQLNENIEYFKERVDKSRFMLSDSPTAIQPILVGSAQRALKLSHYLQKNGIWCSAIRSPTVPINQARLRITLTAAHTFRDIDKLTEVLNAWQQ